MRSLRPTSTIRWVPAAMLLAAVAAPGVRAQTAASDTLPQALNAAVRSRVAARWHLGAADVVLETRFLPGGLPSDSMAGITLLGSGSGGYWVVQVSRGDGPPSSFQVRAGVRTTEVVAARRLARGQALTEADMVMTKAVRWGEPGGRADSVHSVQAGWVTQRLVRAGEPLERPTVRPPLAVVSGRPVALLWKSGAVELRVQGTASGSAPVGQEVFVRTEEGTRLRGVVVAKGVVDVTNQDAIAGTAGGDER